jgi:p-cumate 2,3-dioxygenase alpha subunit
VCRQDRGNANQFQCFYHAWTFNNQGELVGTPEEEGYAAGFDPKERSLVPPPRVENYRGMVFLSYNPEVESLVSYLGDARLFLDTFLDQAGKDRMRVLPGTYRVTVQANWKLMIENTADFYHVVPTHISYIHFLNGIGKRLASQ